MEIYEKHDLCASAGLFLKENHLGERDFPLGTGQGIQKNPGIFCIPRAENMRNSENVQTGYQKNSCEMQKINELFNQLARF